MARPRRQRRPRDERAALRHSRPARTVAEMLGLNPELPAIPPAGRTAYRFPEDAWRALEKVFGEPRGSSVIEFRHPT